MFTGPWPTGATCSGGALNSSTRLQTLSYSLPDSRLCGKITEHCVFQMSSQQHGLHDTHRKFRKKNSEANPAPAMAANWAGSTGNRKWGSDNFPESKRALHHWPCHPCAFCTPRILQKTTVSTVPLKPFKQLAWPLGLCTKAFSLQCALSWMLIFFLKYNKLNVINLSVD